MELLVKVGTVADGQINYQDGDIVCAASQVEIENCHAGMICHPDKVGFNSVALRDTGTLFHLYTEATSVYRFTRLSRVEATRRNLLTGESDIVSSTPNDLGEYIDVGAFLNRRLRHRRHKIFGTAQGREIWYGGTAPRDREHIDILWKDIEGHSDYLQADCGNWPFTPHEKREFLVLNCCGHKSGEVAEVSGGTCGERAAGVEVAGDPDELGKRTSVLIAKKRWQVPYWDLSAELGADVSDIRDKEKEVDTRHIGDKQDWLHLDNVNVDKVAAGIVIT